MLIQSMKFIIAYIRQFYNITNVAIQKSQALAGDKTKQHEHLYMCNNYFAVYRCVLTHCYNKYKFNISLLSINA